MDELEAPICRAIQGLQQADDGCALKCLAYGSFQLACRVEIDEKKTFTLFYHLGVVPVI